MTVLPTTRFGHLRQGCSIQCFILFITYLLLVFDLRVIRPPMFLNFEVFDFPSFSINKLFRPSSFSTSDVFRPLRFFDLQSFRPNDSSNLIQSFFAASDNKRHTHHGQESRKKVKQNKITELKKVCLGIIETNIVLINYSQGPCKPQVQYFLTGNQY